jgi:two-component SAPR family response regulator
MPKMTEREQALLDAVNGAIDDIQDLLNADELSEQQDKRLRETQASLRDAQSLYHVREVAR